MTLLLDLALAVWLLALAMHIGRTGEDRNAIIAFIAFGLLLGLGWVRVSAPDVALTEVAIGGGGTGILLLRAEAHLRRGGMTRPVSGAGKAVAALVCGAVTLGLAVAVLTLPNPAPSLAPASAAALEGTGLGNPVTAVLLAYRALDTVLEKVVVVLALIGVWSLAPDAFWGGAPALRSMAPASLTYLARLLPPFGVVIGIYMFWAGADAPGGTFQAGMVLAAMWLLVILAGLRPEPETGRLALRLLLVGGPAIFLLIGFLGFVIAGGFLAYPEGAAKPLIIGMEATLTVSLAVTLALLVAGPARKAPGP